MYPFILFVLLAFPSFSFDESAYEEAIALAEEKKLSQNPYWETLLHYKSGWFSGFRSLVDDSAFFFAPDGKTNSRAELNATIKALLQEAAAPDVHAICRFPARAAWLKEELPVLADAIPAASCPHYEEITQRIAPEKATLVFPFSSMSDPASIYGHVMIRLEKADSSALLGYAVTYSADAEGAGPLKYIVYGIGGGFDGKYSVLPYSVKLNEYTALDLRDIWEYELDLTKEEVFRMYQHVWEMSLVLSDYYFFDENCAYNLLFFFEAAKPGLKLTDGYVIVLPVDTVNAADKAGLIKDVNFRASHAKKMELIAGRLSHSEVGLAKDIAKGRVAPEEVHGLDVTDEQKAAILDLASELVRYYNKEIYVEKLAEYQGRSVAILMQRATFRLSNDYPVDVPEISPEKSHGSARVLAGGGYAFDSPFIDLGWRLTYHSLDDDVQGYIPGMEVSTLDVKLRYYTDTERLSLDRFTVVDLISLRPMTRLFKSPSWMLSLGFEDRSTNAAHSAYTLYANAGLGGTVRLFGDSYIWLAAFGELQASNRVDSTVTAGAGPRGGVTLDMGSIGKLIADARYLWYIGDSEHQKGLLSLKYGLYPARNHAIVAEGAYHFQPSGDGSEFSLTYRYFF